MDAVSYTHLDVYKRQALNQKVMKFMADNAVNEAQDADAPAEETTAGETAAAEDVYKRQVENLLNLTRIQEGRLDINKKKEVVDDLVASAVRLVSNLSLIHI